MPLFARFRMLALAVVLALGGATGPSVPFAADPAFQPAATHPGGCGPQDHGGTADSPLCQHVCCAAAAIFDGVTAWPVRAPAVFFAPAFVALDGEVVPPDPGPPRPAV